jgi:hypothetical protein
MEKKCTAMIDHKGRHPANPALSSHLKQQRFLLTVSSITGNTSGSIVLVGTDQRVSHTHDNARLKNYSKRYGRTILLRPAMSSSQKHLFFWYPAIIPANVGGGVVDEQNTTPNHPPASHQERNYGRTKPYVYPRTRSEDADNEGAGIVDEHTRPNHPPASHQVRNYGRIQEQQKEDVKTKPYVYPRSSSKGANVVLAKVASTPMIHAAPLANGSSRVSEREERLRRADEREERLRASEQRAADEAEAAQRLDAENRLLVERRRPGAGTRLMKRIANLSWQQWIGSGLVVFGLTLVVVTTVVAICRSGGRVRRLFFTSTNKRREY